MTKNKYYFQYWPEIDELAPVFLIAEKEHYDHEGYFADDIADDVNDELYALGFCDLDESSYEYDGLMEEGRTKLLELGMIEKHLWPKEEE